MKLKFVKKHLSIDAFKDTVINDFTILTGLNGAGKTHLLKAISLGNVLIEGVTSKDILYFNYNDFVVNPITNNNDSKNQEKVKQSNTFKQISFTTYTSKVQQLMQKLFQERNNMPPMDKAIFLIYFNNPTHIQNIFFDTIDFINLEHLKIENGKVDFTLAQNQFTPEFYMFLNSYISFKGDLKELNQEILRTKLEETGKILEEEFKKNDPEYFQFLKKNIPANKSIFLIEQNDFESINLLSSEIANEAKAYAMAKCKNDHNELRATKWGEKINYLNKEDFLKEYGQPPLDLFNEVLEEYDFNGYIIKQHAFYPEPGIDHTNTEIPINLFHKIKKHSTNIQSLSSGEQTLLSLAFLLYKASKLKVLPRVLLLDEIDTALHPSMIKKLLHVIEEVFVNRRGLKILMSTHSPSTIALSNEESIYIMDKKSADIIQKQDKKSAIEFLTEGFMTIDDGLKLFDQISQKEICILTEGNNTSFIKKANEYFGSNKIEVIDVLESCSGKNQLKSLFELMSLLSHKSKIFFVWDCDATDMSSLKERNNTFPFIFPKNLNNKKVLKGVENMFDEVHFTDTFYTIKQKDDGGSLTVLNKKEFENHIIKNGKKSDYNKFEELFKFIASKRTDQKK